MKILFFSHYFPPEGNAPAYRTYEHCVRWARAGHDVTVVTCVPNVPDGVSYAGYRNRLRPQDEMLDGIRVVRVWTWLAPNRRFARRIANYLSYMVSAVWAAILLLPRPDVMVATSPQFFCGWAGVLSSSIRRCPFVLEVRDIWPESIVAVGAMRQGLVIRLLEVLERLMYRSASHIVTVGNGYLRKIVDKVNVAERISVVTNGVDLAQFAPLPRCDTFRRQWSLDDAFVCSYVGTIGMAHGLDVVIRAASRLRDQGRDDIRFLMVGDGAARRALEQETRRCGLASLIIFAGRIPHEEMPQILANSDACLVHLRGTELFETVIPSKIFETMAMERPIIIGVRGEACKLVLQAGAGLPMQPDQEVDLVRAVSRLANDPTFYRGLGGAARQFVARNFDRNQLATTYLKILERVVHDETRRHKTGYWSWKRDKVASGIVDRKPPRGP